MKLEDRKRLAVELGSVVTRLRARGEAWDAGVVDMVAEELRRSVDEDAAVQLRDVAPLAPVGKAKAEHRHKYGADGKCAIAGCAAKPRGAGKQVTLPGA